MTKNEQANLATCLASLGRFDDVVVVDSDSTDGTRAIAQARGVRIASFVWNGRYPKKKQWALETIAFRYPWILYVDADEQVTEPLADEIALAVRQTRHAAYQVTFDYVFLGRTLRHGIAAQKVVLLRKDRAHFPEIDDLGVSRMWEVEGHYQPAIDGSIGRLRCRMVHDDHEALFHYFDRHNRYSDWESDVRSREPIRAQVSSHTTRALGKSLFDRLPARWLWFFVIAFVLRGGFLDGIPGFHYAVSKTFYYWQIDVKTRDLARVRRLR